MKKIWNWIKNIFKPKRQEMDPHAELYLKMPEPEIPIYTDKDGKAVKCGTHNRFKKSCPICKEIAGVI
tara:strand:- start:549 stop:752 length:204 start_codon:yes stop_codon:yes gene_type:complete